MPQKKAVISLEMQSRQVIAKRIISLLRHFASLATFPDIIDIQHYNIILDIKGRGSDPTIKNYVLEEKNIPWLIYNTIMKEILNNVNITEQRNNRDNQIDSHLLTNTITILKIHRNQTRIVLDGIVHWYMEHRNSLSNVTEAYFTRKLWFDAKLIEIFPAMPNLQNLTIAGFITRDSSLTEIIAQSCPNLRKLTFKNSHNIVPPRKNRVPIADMIENLKQLTFLNFLDIVDNITYEEYSYLLTSLRQLETLNVNCYSSAEEILFGDNGDYNITVNLTSIEIENLDNLSLIPKICPNLRKILVGGKSINRNLSVLKQLQHLNQITFGGTHLNATRRFIESCLEEKGGDIEILAFLEVQMVDYTFLQSISQNCPNLRELEFDLCVFNLKAVVPNMYGDVVALFQKVKQFTLKHAYINRTDINDDYLTFILLNCPNLTKLVLYETNTFTDATFNRVCENNLIPKLETLDLSWSYKFTMNTVNLIIDKCQDLEFFVGLDTIEDTKDEFDNLKNLIDQSNLNLQTAAPQCCEELLANKMYC